MDDFTNDPLRVAGHRVESDPRFRWCVGMRDRAGFICVRVADGRPETWYSEHGQFLVSHKHKPVRGLIDLEDAGTLGHLLGLVREAWGDCVQLDEYYTRDGERVANVMCYIPGEYDDDPVEFKAPTDGEALVLALAGAPVHAANSSVTTTGNPTS